MDKIIKGSGGGDYTTIQDFVDAYPGGSSWRGIISDNNNYDENVVIDEGSTVANPIIITVAEANRHSGIAGVGHARIYTSSAGHVIEINDPGVTIEYLDIELYVSCDVSNEGIRIASDGTDALISRCIIHHANSVSDTDGIYAGNWTVDFYVDHCIVYGFQRSGIHAQNFSGANTINCYIDFCSIFNNGTTAGDGNILAAEVSGATTNMYVYNTIALDHGGSADYHEVGTGSVSWTGSDNISSDTTAETLFSDSFNSVTLVEAEPGAGENVWVNDDDSPFDFTLAGENVFTVTQFGLDRAGSEPDARQDFSIDIDDRQRSGCCCISIGAYQYCQALASVAVERKYERGFGRGFMRGTIGD